MFFLYLGIACLYLIALSLRSAVLNIANGLILLVLCIDLLLYLYQNLHPKQKKFSIKFYLSLIHLKKYANIMHLNWLLFITTLFAINAIHAQPFWQGFMHSMQFKAWLYIPLNALFCMRFLRHLNTVPKKQSTVAMQRIFNHWPYALLLAFILPHLVLWLCAIYEFIRYNNYIHPYYYKQSPVMLSQVGCSIAFTALCMAMKTRWHTNAWLKSTALLIFLGASLAIIFFGQSRTAYILYAFNAVLCVIWQRALWLTAFNKINLNLINYFNIKKTYAKFIKIFLMVISMISFALTIQYVLKLPNISSRIQQVQHEFNSFRQSDTQSNQRLRFWYISGQLIEKNLWLGVGNHYFLSRFREAEKEYDGKSIGEEFNHPHNEYLHIGLSFGLPALLIYVLFWCFSYQKAKHLFIFYQQRPMLNNMQKQLLCVLLFFLKLAILNQMLAAAFNSISINMHSKEFFALCIALLWVLDRFKHSCKL